MVWRIYGWLRVFAWFIVTKRRVAGGGGWRRVAVVYGMGGWLRGISRIRIVL
jgi:hypothetical protein